MEATTVIGFVVIIIEFIIYLLYRIKKLTMEKNELKAILTQAIADIKLLKQGNSQVDAETESLANELQAALVSEPETPA